MKNVSSSTVRATQSLTRTLTSAETTPLILSSIIAAFAISLPVSHAATLQTSAIGVGLFSDPVWQSSGSFSFNEPYARLVGASYRFFGGATVTSTATNPTAFNNLYTIRGRADFTLERNGHQIDSFTVALSGSNFIAAHQSGRVTATDSQTRNVALSLENSSGTFTIRSLGGSGSNLQSNGSFNLIYTYDPIGDTFDDPIEPTLSLGGIRTFSKIPSGRWFELPAEPQTRIEATGGETFRQFAASFMGTGGAYRLTANNVDLGMVASGQQITLPADTNKIEISDVRGEILSGMLVPNTTTASSFQVVPEPSSMALLGMGALLAFSRRRSGNGK